MSLVGREPEQAIAIVEKVVSRHPEDGALANLLHRLRNLGDDGSYVLH